MPVLQEKYPQIEFLIQLSSFHPSLFALEPIEEIVERELDDIETVIVYGVGTGRYFDLLEPWLLAKSEREIVFVEDKIEAIAALEASGSFDRIFKSDRVKLAYKMPESSLEELAFAVISMSPTSKIEVFCTKAYRGDTFDKLSVHLFKMSFLIDAMRKETIYYSQLACNLLPNFKRIPGCFFANKMKGSFQGVPAIICGAGPSLQEEIKTLRELEHKALIFAGGSAISALSHAKVLPHFALAIDPNLEEWNCLKRNSAFEVPFIFGSRVLPKIFQAVQGDLGYVQTFSGGPMEQMVEEELGLSGFEFESDGGLPGLSVTTLAINLALHMGCDPIILCGVDLAYKDNKRYAEGVMPIHHIEARTLTCVSSSGEKVKTLAKWVMESEWISNKAKTSKAHFIDATRAGLGFEGIETRSLEEAAQNFYQRDLRGQIRLEIENSRIEGSLYKVIETLCGSNLRISLILDSIVMQLEQEKRIDDPLVILYTSDLKEELAYYKLFNGVENEIDLILKRSMPDLDLVSLAIKKYKRMQEMCQTYQNLFKLG
jgi:hypothetical protein